MTRDDLIADKRYTLHHSSCFRGYVSRKTGGDVMPYNGKFGKGYTVTRPNWNSTRYSIVDYYIEVTV